jgi:hypothetical protein
MNDDAKVIQIANLTQDAARDNPQRRRVYSTNGLSPTIYDYSGGGNLQPLIVEVEDE